MFRVSETSEDDLLYFFKEKYLYVLMSRVGSILRYRALKFEKISWNRFGWNLIQLYEVMRCLLRPNWMKSITYSTKEMGKQYSMTFYVFFYLLLYFLDYATGNITFWSSVFPSFLTVFDKTVRNTKFKKMRIKTRN